MTVEINKAWVLHKKPSGDSSFRVTFFTREFGLLSCLCKGGRAPKKQALLQPFIPLWLAVDERRSWYYLRQIEALAPSADLKSQSLFAALYLNELLYYTLSAQDACPMLYDCYLKTLEVLGSNPDKLLIEVVLRQFEWQLLDLCGQGFLFNEELQSGRAVVPGLFYIFIPGEGFKTAAQGIAGELLLKLAQGDLGELDTLKAAKRINRSAIDYLLGGRELNSRAYARAMSQ